MTPSPLLPDSRPPAAATRLLAIAAFCALVLLLRLTPALPRGAEGLQSQARPSETAATGTEPQSQPAEHRIREGTELVEQPGRFRITGQRVTFFTADGTRRFVGLENLNLDRIAQTITRNPAQLRWQVTGTITEFRGTNFLLVRRAILSTGRTAPATGPVARSSATSRRSASERTTRAGFPGKPSAGEGGG